MPEIYYIEAHNQSIGKVFCFLIQQCYYRNLENIENNIHDSATDATGAIRELDFPFNLLIIANNDKIRDKLDDLLWTYSKKHFIPHATNIDKNLKLQPICISTEIKNFNNAKSIMFFNISNQNLLESITNMEKNNFKKVIYLFDDNSEIKFQELQEIIKKSYLGNIKINYLKQ